MSIFGDRPGTWWIESKKDPRWNKTARAKDLIFTAGLNEEAQDHLKKCRGLYGEQPDDLTYGGMKD